MPPEREALLARVEGDLVTTLLVALRGRAQQKRGNLGAAVQQQSGFDHDVAESFARPQCEWPTLPLDRANALVSDRPAAPVIIPALARAHQKIRRLELLKVFHREGVGHVRSKSEAGVGSKWVPW